jgi:hypothetical protein
VVAVARDSGGAVMPVVQRHPAWRLHAHCQRAGITDKQIAREFVCDVIGVRGRDSLTKLSRDQIAFADEQLGKCSNDELASKYAEFLDARARELVNLEELIGGAS